DAGRADSLWPEILSYDFWRLPTSSIWDISWHVADERQRQPSASWSRALLADGKRFRIPALLMLALAGGRGQETGESMLDYLIGSTMVDTNEPDLPRVYSPLRDYYTNRQVRETQPELFYETLTHLTVLRARLREHQAANDAALTLQDIVDFVD